MPTNLYGPGDNYDLENSHVMPALIRKLHEAKVSPTVTVWGTGTPRREFLYSDDMADACVFLMGLPDEPFSTLLGQDEFKTGIFKPPIVNVGLGEDLTIRELAALVSDAVGYMGDTVFDTTKHDGTPRKLLDMTRLSKIGWRTNMPMDAGLRRAYADFLNLNR